ncbi:SAM-dependent methyltransferase [Devosia sp. Root685]|uniref:class I SAM-dependent methyltransferase n=1 Tax=Devosia sp. Root685 TaxID=1736587 RepID=UPI0006FAAD72|nr:class I SAM-dependent methyltransferase [Devosia sp. Root685]KRA98216.1 SAM-dependent methyltransferase [Devosia sp. Root685]
MSGQQAFWNRMADRYAAQPIADEAAYQTKLAATRRLLRPDMELFEFGCGTGSIALIHAANVGHIRAVDFSERMIEIAEEKAKKAGVENIDFEVGSIENVELAPQSLDMVLGMSILHLLKNKEAAIAKVFRALKPGGYFITSTACLSDMMPLIRFVAPLGNRLGLLPHLDVMTQSQLRTAIETAGFAVEHEWLPKKKSAAFMIARKPAL